MLLAVLVTVLIIVAFITSVIWMPILLCFDARVCADITEDRYRDVGRTWPDKLALALCAVLFGFVLRLVWKPIVDLLPMSRRKFFISSGMSFGRKDISEYSPKTQVKYFENVDVRTKLDLLRFKFTKAVMDLIWWRGDYEEIFIKAGCHLTTDQFIDLVSCKPDLAKNYLLKRTPRNEIIDALVKAAKPNARAWEVLVNWLSCQKPSEQLVAKVLSVSNKETAETIIKIVDRWADMDAVNGIHYPDLTFEETLEAKKADWENFCKGKENIYYKAQAKMDFIQYKVFHETGHQVDKRALESLLVSVKMPRYIRELLTNEWETLDEKVLAVVKADAVKYAIYMAVKKLKN